MIKRELQSKNYVLKLILKVKLSELTNIKCLIIYWILIIPFCYRFLKSHYDNLAKFNSRKTAKLALRRRKLHTFIYVSIICNMFSIPSYSFWYEVTVPNGNLCWKKHKPLFFVSQYFCTIILLEYGATFIVSWQILWLPLFLYLKCCQKLYVCSSAA